MTDNPQFWGICLGGYVMWMKLALGLAMAGVLAALMLPAADRARDKNVVMAKQDKVRRQAGTDERDLSERIRQGANTQRDSGSEPNHPGIIPAPTPKETANPAAGQGRKSGGAALTEYIAALAKTGAPETPGGQSGNTPPVAVPEPAKTRENYPVEVNLTPNRGWGTSGKSESKPLTFTSRNLPAKTVDQTGAAGGKAALAGDIMAMAPAGGMKQEREGFTEMRRVRVAGRDNAKAVTEKAAGGVAGAAFASLAGGDACGSCGGGTTVRGADFCERDATFAAAPYPELPAKGVKFWGRAEGFREKQDPWESGQNVYQQERMTYSVGATKDWTIDSTLGFSADWIESKVKSRQTDDYRQNQISGYRLNAHYYGTCMAQFPFAATAYYGRINNEGSGHTTSEDVLHPGSYINDPWSEPRHRSQIYGFSGKIGAPLIWGNDFKVLPEIGIDYRRVESEAYSFSHPGTTDTEMPGLTSKSLQVPLTVSVKKDYAQCWGIFSPKVMGGALREFEDSAIGERVFNAASASNFDAAASPQEVVFQPSQKAFYHVGAGVELRTVGGWEIFADYRHHWSNKWQKDEFKLKLGRNF